MPLWSEKVLEIISVVIYSLRLALGSREFSEGGKEGLLITSGNLPALVSGPEAY